MWEHKENDNLDVEEIERFRKKSQEERNKLMEEMEQKIKKKSMNQRSASICEEIHRFFFYLRNK